MQVTRVPSDMLDAQVRRDVLTLCELAYQEDLVSYLEHAGPGVHLLGIVNDALVAHLMIVERSLVCDHVHPVRTGYVELVATHPEWQRQGLATRLLRDAAHDLAQFELGALSPSSADFYARLGWEMWRGPLFVRRLEQPEPTPDECVMILRTKHTPSWLDLDSDLSVEWREGEVW